jgi:hypothetical protein
MTKLSPTIEIEQNETKVRSESKPEDARRRRQAAASDALDLTSPDPARAERRPTRIDC